MPRRRPNVLMLAVDSLRRDHMSCYGYHRLTSPHLDQLARRGVLFENMFSPSVPTPPGYSSILTGDDVMGHGVVALSAKEPINPNLPTLPEILRDDGYTTACVGFGGQFYRGFDRYADAGKWVSWEDRPAPKAEDVNSKALPILEEMVGSGQPWLLFLRHTDPHSPYLPPAPFDTMFYSQDPCDPKLPETIKPAFDFKPFADFFKSWMPPGLRDIDYPVAQYDGMIAYMDACIARIFTRMAELGVADDTLIVLTADHGETLTEHDCYFDHHGTYEPTLMVPLVLCWPGVLPEGVRMRSMVALEDVAPTVIDLLKLPKGRKVKFHGHSLLPMIRGEVKEYRSELYLTECAWMRKRGWRTPEWKLIEAQEPDFHNKPPVELYNLVLDPLELNNLAGKEPKMVDTLKTRMYRWVEKRMKETGRPDPIVDYHLGTDKRIGSIAVAQKLQNR